MTKVRQIVNKDKSEEAQSPVTILQVLKVVFTNEDRESW